MQNLFAVLLTSFAASAPGDAAGDAAGHTPLSATEIAVMAEKKIEATQSVIVTPTWAQDLAPADAALGLDDLKTGKF